MAVAVIKGRTAAGVGKVLKAKTTEDTYAALTVSVEDLPEVALDSATVSALTPLSSVGITGTPNVAVTSLPDVALDSDTITALTPPASVGITGTVTATFPMSVVSGTIQRPANTTQYTAGDVWGTASDSLIAINNCVPANGGSGLIIGATVITSTATVTNKTFNLHVWTAEPTADIADHAAFSLAWADIANYVGCIEGVICSVENATDASAHATFAVDKLAFTCGAASKYLYIQPVVAAAYTPGSGETLSVALKILN